MSTIWQCPAPPPFCRSWWRLFPRWLLPLTWTLVALVLFAALRLPGAKRTSPTAIVFSCACSRAKALLIAITTPLAILLGMLLVRRPTLAVWAGLLVVQVATVGVSSSGVITTLLATAIGLGVGLVLSPSRTGLLAAAAGATTLIYPIGMALWLKLGNARTADIAALGTVSDIGSSLGAGWRQGVVVAVLAVAVWLTSARRGWANADGSPQIRQRRSVSPCWWRRACSSPSIRSWPRWPRPSLQRT